MTPEVETQTQEITTTEETQETQKTEEGPIKEIETKGEEGPIKEIKQGEGEPAPEEYEAFNIPEGIEINESIMAEVKELSKSTQLSQVDAQKWVDLGVKLVQANEAELIESLKEVQETWAKNLLQDKEIGGKNYKETVMRANRTLRKFDPKGNFGNFLKEQKIINHPEMMRFLRYVDTKTSEGTLEEGDKTRGEKTAAQTLFPQFKSGAVG